ncbi:aminotransferase class V-fold PLP-dependent enzyme [cf. Phormidesmis sp. LEGE 11477]|uniref:pyridoxal phosphate-dependent decarboxylase family protein n=1 Tax=cf. Phormidesmis sp. LEGE 11477 TaxID=1828680 RepID=UPI0018802071|nr:aminotransferase class V-fold PLP-dependent enzyme [cf. Phormidesmis sp. LEGE 11477]MBE9060426.1 aminotransferase class V-fold PLP-dependent enzyme [cf. Phormidesmis sp. LEGE 11477]
MFKASDYYELLQQLEDFLAAADGSGPLKPPLAPVALKSQLSLDLPDAGKPIKDLQTDIAHYLNNALKTAHHSYFNQLWGGFNAACFMGDVITSAANTSMYTYEVAPIATLIEQTLIAKMSDLVGFEAAEGQFTTGGSNGNLMAMAIARHQALPAIKRSGMANGPRLIAFVSEEAHYSFDKAAHLLGLGTEQLWKVPTDSAGKMSSKALAELIDKAHAQGAVPFFVAGTAGTTVRGAYDPFEEIGAIAREQNLWFHIDGAWGASVLLSPTHRHLMNGANLADSVVWDAHKMMGMTLMCSLLLVKQRGQMLNTFSASGTDYLFHAEAAPMAGSTEAPTDFGPATMHCGRRVDALKLWLVWRHLGDRGWEALIDSYFELASQAEAIIQAHPLLELVSARESVNLCFRYLPQNRQHADRLTLSVRQALWESGTAMVNYAQVEEKTIFRLVICNNQTRSKDIDQFFEALVAIAQRLEQEMR